MDISRAKAILSAKNTITVELDGTPIWIESINENNNTATVHTEGQHEMSRTVRITELQEKL